MDIRPHCEQNTGNGSPGHTGHIDKFYREICPGKFQCLVCGNIQDHSGSCAHCGMRFENSKG